MPKHSQRETRIEAFQAVVQGARYLPAGFKDVPDDATPAHEDSGMIAKRLASLTNQRARILQLICAGKLNKQIAFDLSIAETTVKAHVTAVMRKRGVQSRTQAVLLASKASFTRILPEESNPV